MTPHTWAIFRTVDIRGLSLTPASMYQIVRSPTAARRASSETERPARVRASLKALAVVIFCVTSATVRRGLQFSKLNLEVVLHSL